jgi:hypothetical protein
MDQSHVADIHTVIIFFSLVESQPNSFEKETK